MVWLGEFEENRILQRVHQVQLLEDFPPGQVESKDLGEEDHKGEVEFPLPLIKNSCCELHHSVLMQIEAYFKPSYIV